MREYCTQLADLNKYPDSIFHILMSISILHLNVIDLNSLSLLHQ